MKYFSRSFSQSVQVVGALVMSMNEILCAVQIRSCVASTTIKSQKAVAHSLSPFLFILNTSLKVVGMLPFYLDRKAHE